MEQRDEVSLFDLWNILAEQRKVIFIVFTACVCVGLAYALLAKPVYKAEAFLLPPSQKDIQALNVGEAGEAGRVRRVVGVVGVDEVGGVGGVDYTPALVYELFVRELKSRSNRRLFFDENNIAVELGFDAQKSNGLDDFFGSEFNDKVKVQVGKGIDKEFISLTLETYSAENAAKWVNGIISSASQSVSKRLVSDVKFKITLSRAALEDTISGKKTVAEQRRKDRVVKLEEAITIAEKMNNDERVARSTGRYGTVLASTEDVPLYMMSLDALRAEILVLEKRKDDAPFIKGLRDLQEHLARLEHMMKMDVSNVKPVFIDQVAVAPRSPVKPKKRLIVVLSGVLGLMLGVFGAFIRHVVLRHSVEMESA